MRRVIAVGVAAVVVIAGALFWFLRGDEGPEETARGYVEAWGRGDFAAMKALTANPPVDFVQRYQQMQKDLGASAWRFTVASTGRPKDDRAGGAYRADITLKGGHAWSYEGTLPFVRTDGKWLVDWTPQLMHPAFGEGLRFKAARAYPEPANVFAADGQVLNGHSSGSVQQLVQGLQEQYEERLLGTPAMTISLVNGQNKSVKTLQRFGGKDGRPMRTTLDLGVQEAAVAALANARKPTSLVALRPSTGEILAVANKPGGYNRALLGHYPPGSTFKVVTAAAISAGGLAPGTTVACPATTNIGGRTFKNYKSEDFGRVPFREAFAHSCNTTFARLAVDKLGEKRLSEVARMFGFGAPIIAGVPAVRADFPNTSDETDLAAASFGQGKVLTSPLNMASVAAAAANGTWRSPRLVPAAEAAQALDAKGRKPEAPRRLEPGVSRALRTLMPAVVSEGTAAEVSFPAGTAGKTGTAEFGSAANPPTHAWFIGYRGNLAFAVIVEDGGTGAEAAAPIAARFLRAR
jgi:transpeptidase family protein/MecA-like transpeptidase family protein